MAAVSLEAREPPLHARALAEVIDFGQGLFHGAVENPLNAGAQVINRAAHMHLPELHLVDEARINESTGGRFGSNVGYVADMYLLGSAAGSLGSFGVLGSSLRMGAVGGVYFGLLTPTDANSPTFWIDRLKNGAIGGITLAAMGASAGALDKTGFFAREANRSLGGSVLFGAMSGVGGGFANAHANALLREGRLPTFAEVQTAEKSFITLGALYGVAGFAHHKISGALAGAVETADSMAAGEAAVTTGDVTYGSDALTKVVLKSLARRARDAALTLI